MVVALAQGVQRDVRPNVGRRRTALVCVEVARPAGGRMMEPVFLEDGMKRLHSLWLSIVGLALTLPMLLPSLALAAKKGPAHVVIVADTRRLDGIMLWWAEMYNERHLYFTILTIIIIPVTGCIFGMLADLVMNHIGIDLKHRELAEH